MFHTRRSGELHFSHNAAHVTLPAINRQLALSQASKQRLVELFVPSLRIYIKVCGKKCLISESQLSWFHRQPSMSLVRLKFHLGEVTMLQAAWTLRYLIETDVVFSRGCKMATFSAATPAAQLFFAQTPSFLHLPSANDTRKPPLFNNINIEWKMSQHINDRNNFSNNMNRFDERGNPILTDYRSRLLAWLSPLEPRLRQRAPYQRRRGMAHAN